MNLYRGHQYCITELLRIAGQVWCTLQWWSLCKHFWSTSWHLEGRQEEENFDLWWRTASAGCSWPCGDNPIASSCCCCRLRHTEPPDPIPYRWYACTLLCLYISWTICYSQSPDGCYCVMYEVVVLKKLACLHMVVLWHCRCFFSSDPESFFFLTLLSHFFFFLLLGHLINNYFSHQHMLPPWSMHFLL